MLGRQTVRQDFARSFDLNQLSSAVDSITLIAASYLATGRKPRMPVFQAKRRIRHSAHEMFDLVADVERYSAFVPLCERHVIRSRTKCGETEVLITDMTVAYRIFRETIRSRVTLDQASGRIVVQGIDGPLCELQTCWTFQAREADSCDVGFYLSYELASRTLALLMGAVFDAAFARFVDAFQRRADIVYGRGVVAAVRPVEAQVRLDRRRQSGVGKTASPDSTMHHGKCAAS
jgi:coenzyme Q-binding protein COQ10